MFQKFYINRERLAVADKQLGYINIIYFTIMNHIEITLQFINTHNFI